MNHYEVLEVSPAASPEVIRAAYRSLMQRFHPDKNPGDEAVAARAAAIAAAYDLLSDPGKRAEYDQQLQQMAQGQGPAPAAGRPAGPPAHVARARRATSSQSSAWWLWLVPVIVGLAIGGFAAFKPKKVVDPRAELAAIKQSFASQAATEAQRQELYVRKTELLERHPELLREATAEKAEDMAVRTFVLLEAPLVVKVGEGQPTTQLTLREVSLLVGSFDAQQMLALMEEQRERMVLNLKERFAHEDPELFTGPDGEANIKRVVKASVVGTLRTNPGQVYPSTYFESPGRHGVVDVLLPARFKVVVAEPKSEPQPEAAKSEPPAAN